MISRNTSLVLLLALTVLVALTAVLLPPIPQPQSYHLFADQRSLLGIPAFCGRDLEFSLRGRWNMRVDLLISSLCKCNPAVY